MPPSRASAIASRASVTVSIAAETIGIASAIVRVSRVARRDVVRQHVRLGRARAGRRRRSGPRGANFSSSARSSLDPSKLELDSANRAVSAATAAASADRARARRPRRRATSRPASRGSKRPGADLERRRRARGDARAAARPRASCPASLRGDEGGEQDVAGADAETPRRCGATRAVARAACRSSRRSAKQPRLVRDQHVARAELGDRVERDQRSPPRP